MQGLMLLNTFIRHQADGMEKRHPAWQGGAALGWVSGGTGDCMRGAFQSLLG